MIFRKATLENGLEIIAECNDAAYSIAVGFFVNTGSRDETEEIGGVSHFLEHMMFKGTARRSADDVNRQLDDMGAHANAFTSEELTVYYAAMLPELQDQAVDLLGDIMRPALREEDFEMEKKVILEEIHMYQDQPPFGADDRVRSLFFRDHPLGRSVLGTAESVAELSVEQMQAYFLKQYSPGNLVLVGAGAIDFDRFVAMASETCGHWEPIETQRALSSPSPGKGLEILHKETATQQYMIQLAHGPSAMDHQRYAAKLLATILGDDSGSRLYWDLVDPGLAEYVSMGHQEHLDAGIFLTYMCCQAENTKKNMDLLNETLENAAKEGVTEEELARAKSKVLSRIVLSSERPRGRLFGVGAEWILRKEYFSVKNDIEILDGITLDQIHEVLEKYPLNESQTILVGPKKTL